MISVSVEDETGSIQHEERKMGALKSLTNGSKTNAYRALVHPRGWTCGFISRADVADFLVKQIDDDAFLHKTTPFCIRRRCSRADANAAIVAAAQVKTTAITTA
jgi:uncharacterized protein YbjT (DUF2867 family)